MNIEKIKKLHNLALENQIGFEEYSKESLSAGLDRVYFDLSGRKHVFYSTENSFETVLPTQIEYSVASKYSESRLKDAIRAFDSKEISWPKLISEVAASGICLAYCFIKENKAMYISTDGNFYLEHW